MLEPGVLPRIPDNYKQAIFKFTISSNGKVFWRKEGTFVCLTMLTQDTDIQGAETWYILSKVRRKGRPLKRLSFKNKQTNITFA